MQKSYLYALLAVLLWSTVASAFKLSLQSLTVIELLLIAGMTSVIVLFLLIILTGKLQLFHCLRAKDYFRAVLFGFLNPFLYYIVLFNAYDLLPAQQAQTINYTWAIILSLLAVPILKQPLSKADIAGLVIAFTGVLIISTQGSLTSFDKTNITGIYYALSSTIIWALYWVFNTKQTNDPIVSLFLNFIFGFIFSFIYYVVVYYAMASPEVIPTHINRSGIIEAVYVGLFEMSLTFYLWLLALKSSQNTAKISSLIFLSPFLSLVFIHYFVGEEIHIATFIGLIVIILGVLIQRIK